VRTHSMFVAIVWIMLASAEAFPCTATASDSYTMVAAADLILRVTAVSYSSPPPTIKPQIGPTLVPDPLVPDADVEFVVEEVVKGSYDKPNIVLPGLLGEQDEWNRGNPPYLSARPSADGRCFATIYRKGGQYLLVLKKWTTSFGGRAMVHGYAVYWAPLAPVNEQLRSSDDPWVQWVRAQVRAK
jgi:hypothetical protein